ncbi:MAG TPA: HAD-IC family P-type ATPase, partial [archaeon]|nr:HAD-IC family P-type ATPase [archaeon]
MKTDLVIPDRRNMVWTGTAITKGRGRAVVVATGMKTEIGEIAKEIQIKEEETPLQKKLGSLGNQLGFIIILISAFVALAGFFILNLEVWEALKTGIALAVAAIPEGLPAVATLTLALGIRKMSKNNAIVRKLASVETLGSCTVICSDKTGTITKNEITAQKVYTDKIYTIEKLDPKTSELLLRTAILCNNADLDSNLGDPTELALLKLAKPKGFDMKDLEKKFPRKDEILFSSERKRMSTVTDKEVYSKGAVEIILKSCTHLFKDGKILRLTESDRKQILEANNKLTQEALRVLGFSYKEITKTKRQNNNQLEQDHIFLGLIGMIDPPREEVKESIKICKQAGIRVVMITGDHVLTAEAVGKQIGLDGVSLTGIDL